MQAFIFVYEEQGVAAVIVASSPKQAIKDLAALMYKRNPDQYSSDPADYEDDLDNGAWAMYDGPSDVQISKSFVGRFHEDA